MRQEKKPSKGRRTAAAVCNILEVVLLIPVILAGVSLTLPNLVGYRVYNVISGSMEPAIGIGSLALVRPCEAAGILEGDVIAYAGSTETGTEADTETDTESDTETGTVIIHRVVENQIAAGHLVTRGDANGGNDIRPVAYEQFLGKVIFSVPFLGMVLQGMTSQSGKVAAICMVILALLLHCIAGSLKSDPERISGEKK